MLAWFVDDDDPLWTPWRAVLLWCLVAALIVAVAVVATHIGWHDNSGRPCPPVSSATGDC